MCILVNIKVQKKHKKLILFLLYPSKKLKPEPVSLLK